MVCSKYVLEGFNTTGKSRLTNKFHSIFSIKIAFQHKWTIWPKYSSKLGKLVSHDLF